MFKIFGVALVVVAVALAVVPMFTDCQSQGKSLTTSGGKTVPMKCHWTGVAELATAMPLAVVGGMMVVSRRKQSLQYLSVLGVVLGGVAVALPNKLIGVCATPTMLCHTTMSPALTAMGAATVAIGIVGLIMASGKKSILDTVEKD
ncbi:MAG: hypothetical protein A2147_03955 [Chloroflexi bacterium RBG_16_57_8]|nr:MAG: hypothetical protein A2147_03955 [Chloroflexi bacterium RBG_16_57_8]